MKTSKILIGALLFLTGTVSCEKKGDDVITPLNLPLKTAEVITADNSFGFELYQKLSADAASGTNLMISPLSVSQALAMTYNGAAGDTKTAMEEAMRTAGIDRDELNELNKTLVTALLAHDPKVTLEIANSIWYRNEYTILEDFVQRNEDYYDAVVNAMDFTDPGCKDVINNWVDEKTHGKIDEIVKEIKPESFMFLINAIYFKGVWKYEFAKKDTKTMSFTKEDGTSVDVDMMHRKIDVNRLSNDLFTSVELPYGEGNWRMFLFLPESGKTLKEVEDQLTSENWNLWMTQYSEVKELELYMPRFKFAYEESLKNSLAAMGMDVAFSDLADFSGILQGGGLMISDVKHKTFVEVNEEGTEAAAVTSVEIVLTSIGEFLYCNKPFLFAIAEKSSGTILFLGRLMNPND
ncbi:MAG: serpin family protein [Bacteroidota bacterium]